MMNDVLWAALAHGTLDRVPHQMGPRTVRHRPADDLAVRCFTFDGKVGEPGRGRHIRDVGYSIIDVLMQLAKDFAITPSAVALAWVRERPGIRSTLIGAHSLGQ